MSRIARKPLEIPKGVEVSLDNACIRVKGKNGEFNLPLSDAVQVVIENNFINVAAKKNKSSMVGTTCVLVANMMKGVSTGFEEKLKLFGVGYKAELNGDVLELKLGFSHQKFYPAPQGITFKLTSPTEISVLGMDKQSVGQVAADIRKIRPPESYKGKGVRYEKEAIILKEIKKK